MAAPVGWQLAWSCGIIPSTFELQLPVGLPLGAHLSLCLHSCHHGRGSRNAIIHVALSMTTIPDIYVYIKGAGACNASPMYRTMQLLTIHLHVISAVCGRPEYSALKELPAHSTPHLRGEALSITSSPWLPLWSSLKSADIIRSSCKASSEEMGSCNEGPKQGVRFIAT